MNRRHEDALALSFEFEGRTITVRDYLRKLLLTLWDEGEMFSGKRPFGNSGWDYDLYVPLIRAGLIEDALDEYGYVQDVAEAKAHAFVRQLIIAAFA